MDKYAVPSSIIHLDVRTTNPQLAIRLRILWHLWRHQSIDSYVFNNTEDILFGIQIMLRNKVYCRHAIQQLEEKTIHYMFPGNRIVNYGRPAQMRYLLLQKLFIFIGSYAGISFAASYGYIEFASRINLQEEAALGALEHSLLDLCDFLTSLSMQDIQRIKLTNML